MRLENDLVETDSIQYQEKHTTYVKKRYYMFHKPSGCVTACKDDKQKTVMEYIKKVDQEGLFPVGRLDKDTEGLLLFTNDGAFAHCLMHPKKKVPKTYFFWAVGSLDQEAIHALQNGILLNEGEVSQPAKVEVLQEGRYEEYETKLEQLYLRSCRMRKETQKVVSGYLTITEGKKHQVKRMLKAVGCYVIYLKRTAIGLLLLDEALLPGRYRQLQEQELFLLQQDSCEGD